MGGGFLCFLRRVVRVQCFRGSRSFMVFRLAWVEDFQDSR